MNTDKQLTLDWILKYNRTPYPYSLQSAALKGLKPKQPCFFSGRDYLKPVDWKDYQDWGSLDENFKTELIKAWHGDSRIEGIGCNAGWNGEFYFSMVDIDRKTFESLEAMEQAVTGWENRNPGMSLCPRSKTQSRGYRYYIGFESVPKDWGNTISFTFTQGGEKSLGELMTGPGGLGIILGKGLKEEYLWDRNPCGEVLVFPNPESIGLYQVEKAIAPSGTSIYDNPDTPEQAREALNSIPVNQFDGDYQGWINIGMACKAAGLDFEDWDNWSQGSKSYSNSKDTFNHWKSFKDGGGITAATLFKFAKDNGYKPPRKQQQQTPLINTSKPNFQTSGNTALKPEQQSNVLPFQRQQETAKLPPIKEKIKDLLGRNLSGAELENEFLELSGIYLRYPKNAIESLYRKLSEESEK
ncbi:PriCT-2 domain-containing protein, partial [Planktothrix agardhii]|uniref:PriCT-2 domain-containing protein n=1 Tax=Planktothrix agardhii TaxID=1160 RepID=UPI002B1F5DC0